MKKDFIKLTRTADTEGGEVWVSRYQIKFMESDERHSQTYIYYSDRELKVTESLEDILALFGDK